MGCGHFDLRVFYVKFSSCSSPLPQLLTFRITPQNAETTAVEVNRKRFFFSKNSFVSLSLCRNRVDKECEEATFVGTDSVRSTGALEFQVYDKENILVCGILEGFKKGCCMDCYSALGPADWGYLRGTKSFVEVYVAGSFSGCPLILTKTVQLIARRKISLDAIPEHEDTTQDILDGNLHNDHQIPEDRAYGEFYEKNEESVSSMYSRSTYVETDDSELSWFNAGVRVGVGIGLGMCLGIGIGIGLLVRTYRSTTKNFRKRLL
ncbi:hypothetical protein SUGI_0579960 [Cryptomeria japonica]|uniref:uncharacterized protein At1g01500-like n=1 Tax=Cryptomeria japonica TaxID=3369 RepID=UPI0024146FDB|nr:uncharacterized protein At1g01500-like [Cryptomeria japonica]GLJ29417.1 hypothetical protein SUGI_0579960 [Cryptomeria japonica]